VGYDFGLLKEVQKINAQQMARFVKKIGDTLWVVKDKTIGVLGLAFKQNTDDVRMSPAIELCQLLLREGAKLRVHDPKAMEKAKALLKDVTYVDDMNEVAEGCDYKYRAGRKTSRGLCCAHAGTARLSADRTVNSTR